LHKRFQAGCSPVNQSKMIFQKNIQIIEKRWPHLMERCAGDVDSDECRGYELLFSGHKALVRLSDGNERFLHSPIEPVNEAARWVKNQAWKSEVVIILGFGCGYHVEAALGEKEIKHLLVCEICPTLFKQVIDHVDVSSFLKDTRLELILGGCEEVEKLSQAFVASEKAVVWRYMPAVNLYPEKYEAVESYLNQRMAETRGFIRPYDSLGPLKLHHGVSLLMQDIIK